MRAIEERTTKFAMPQEKVENPKKEKNDGKLRKSEGAYERGLPQQERKKEYDTEECKKLSAK